MDPLKNKIPSKIDTIHLLAVCGTGMAALAVMLRDLGYRVSGSDQNVYPPMSTFLADHGISIRQGYKPAHLDSHLDLVIVGNAISRDNPEAMRLAELGLHYCSMPQAVNHFLAKGKKALVVTGTHGKTTTSSLLAWILYKAGRDPSFIIGGILHNFKSNHRLGGGDFVVIEGDEYDTAFFDKGPKFLHYRPHTAILTSVEFDHADIFTDLNHVTAAFDQFLNGVPDHCRVFAFDGDKNIAALTTAVTGNRPAMVRKYGCQPDSMWRLGSARIENGWTDFDIFKREKHFGKFRTRLPGRHNLLNTLAAVAVADRIGLTASEIAGALETFTGIRRRQEVRGIKRDITVIDDFAHHPTAVLETVAAIRSHYPAGRLIAVFEPRTNTSMRNVFQKTYATVFDPADIICIRTPSMIQKVPTAERFSSKKLVSDLIHRKKDAHHFENTDQIISYLIDIAMAGDVILVMSNGGFDNIHQRLLDRL
ncbi:MAG: UDP-N-acetylmuramate:L-alanyl-gamma-D-glutamyl-meso-diaminopimelate ligase [Deltaproteobacteria bacterium]|nr:MAG: UDP-N-acetylmuramate:L-alanyl-gamma-D-glutamyl-meso-diaminopimelate ligase [Deltaproteobacteria bacterium]